MRSHNSSQIYTPCARGVNFDLYFCANILQSALSSAQQIACFNSKQNFAFMFLLRTIRLPTVMLIAQAVFISERGHADSQTDRQTNRVTDATDIHLTDAPDTARTGNN